MNWKREITLLDLDGTEEIEVTCQRCGIMRYRKATDLLKVDELANAYLDEVERHIRCEVRACRGTVKIALVHDGKTEGFVGGLA